MNLNPRNLPVSLSMEDNFPAKVRARQETILHEPISTTIGLTGLLASIMGSSAAGAGAMVGIGVGGSIIGVTAGGLGGMIVTVAISAALSLASSLLSSKPKADSALNSRGLYANTRNATDKRRLPYGTVPSGGQWVFQESTSEDTRKINDMFHLVIDWGWGVQAIAKDIEKPHFNGRGKSGLINNGIYTGLTDSHYLVRIEAGGASFKWSNDGGSTWEATGVAITGAWQNLDDGAQIMFPETTGFTQNDEWDFWAGDGLWVDNRLYYYWTDLFNKQWIWHNFHSGTSDQTVDTDLQGYFPKWTSARRHRCYSYIRLKGSTNQDGTVWESIPEFRLTRKKVDLYDTRTGIPAFSDNRALVYLDYKVSTLYGEGKDPSYVNLQSVSDLANWYDAIDSGAGGFKFNGVLMDAQEHGDILDQILFAGRAFRVDCGGSEKIKAYDDDSSVTTFSDFKKQIVIDSEKFSLSGPGILEAPHRVICAYFNPKKDWTYDDQKAEVAGIGTIESLRKVIEHKYELLGITNALDAKRISNFQLLWQNAELYNIQCHPKVTDLESGDMFTATHAWPGWSAEKVRLASIGRVQSGPVPVVVREESSTYYDLDLDVDEDDAPPVNPPAPPAPPEVPVVSSTKITGRQLQVKFSPLTDEGDMEYIEVYGSLTASFTPDTATFANRITKSKSLTHTYTMPTAWVNVTIYLQARLIARDGEPSTFCAEWSTADPKPPTTEEITFLAHYDGPEPSQADFTGNPVDSLGLAPAVNLGVIFRPGRFGKGIEACEDTINCVLNPSAEVVGNFANHSGATVALDGSKGYIGNGSYLVQTTGAGDGIELTLGALSNAVHYLSYRVKGALPAGGLVATVDGGAHYLVPVLLGTVTAVNGWALYGIQIPQAQANGSTLLVLMQNGAGTGYFNLDAVQIEAKPYRTPYADSTLGSGHTSVGGLHVRAASELTYDPDFVSKEKGSWILNYRPACSDQSAGARHRQLFDLRDNPSNMNAPVLYHDKNTNKLTFWVNGAALLEYVLALVADTSYQIAVTYDFTADLYAMYVNGVLVASSTAAQAQPTLGAALWVGSNYSAVGQANGIIDDLCHVNRPITAEEVAALYESNAPISMISSKLEDRLAPQPDPPTGMGNDAVENQKTGIDKRQCRIYCTACTDTSKTPVKYYFEYYVDPNSTKISHTTWLTSPETTLRDLDIDTTIKWRVKAKDVNDNETSACAWQSISVSHDTATPSDVSGVAVIVKGTDFEISWTRPAGANIDGYRVYVHTSDSSGSSKLIKEESKLKNKSTIGVGTSTVSGSSDYALAYDTNYYFWVKAITRTGVESANYVAATGNPVKVHKAEWQQMHSIPWKLTRPRHVRKTQTGAGTQTYTVPDGKAATLVSTKGNGDGGTNTFTIQINDVIWLASSAASTQRLNTTSLNGIYVTYGDHIDLICMAGAYGEFTVIEWDADVDTDAVFLYITTASTYTIPAGYKFYLTFANAVVAGSETYIQVSVDGGSTWENVTDIGFEVYHSAHGPLLFEVGAGSDVQLRSSAANGIYMCGLLVKSIAY